MKDSVFVDTNILVYARDTSEPEKQAVAENLLKHLFEQRIGRISAQVLNEYYVTVTQKLKPGMSSEDAWADVMVFQHWNPVPVDLRLLEQGYLFQQQYCLSWWDALILGAAALADCRQVYSEDLSHGQIYFGIQVVNPFVKS